MVNFRELIISALILVYIGGPSLASPEHLFSTWEGLEPDKCASAWLIKRFVDKEAHFKFFPKGEIITEGIPFDTPEAELRRYHNLSTFESIIKKYRLTNPALLEIGVIIHDIEINYWGKKQREQSGRIYQEIRKIISSARDEMKVLERCFVYFDHLYNEINLKGQ